MWGPDYPVRTARLALRPWRSEDLEDYVAIRTDPEVARHIPGHPLTRDESIEWFAQAGSEIKKAGQALSLAIERLEDATIVGMAGLYWRNDVHRQAEIGFILLPPFFGQGFATEASAALLELAFVGLGAHRVFAVLDASNRASEKVCQRLGMRREGLHVGAYVDGDTWVDSLTYALVEEEWRKSLATSGG